MTIKEPRTLLHEYFLREGDNVSQRTDWFLIFHAILIEGFFAAPHQIRYTVPILCLGFATSALWLVIGIRQSWTMHLLFNAVADTPGGGTTLRQISCAVRSSQEKHQQRWYRWIKAAPVFAVVIPLLTLLTWRALSFVSILHAGFSYLSVVLILTLLPVFLARVCWVAGRIGPNNDAQMAFKKSIEESSCDTPTKSSVD